MIVSRLVNQLADPNVSEFEVFGLGKLSIVQAIGTRGTNLSAKVMRLIGPRAGEGSTAFKVNDFGGNDGGGGSAVSRR